LPFPCSFSNSLTSSLCAQRSRTKIKDSSGKGQGARGLDLKDLFLLPSSPPSLPWLHVLITLGLEKKRVRVVPQQIY